LKLGNRIENIDEKYEDLLMGVRNEFQKVIDALITKRDLIVSQLTRVSVAAKTEMQVKLDATEK